jgi:hypothetical protein
MGCLMVDTHGCDSTSRLPQARFPLRTLRDREGAAGHRPTRPVGQTAWSNWTTCPVLTDRTDTRNLEGQGCPVAGEDGSIVFDTDQPARREIRSTNDPGAPGKHEAKVETGPFGAIASFPRRSDAAWRSLTVAALIQNVQRFGHGDFGRPNRHAPLPHFLFPPCRITQMSVT